MKAREAMKKMRECMQSSIDLNTTTGCPIDPFYLSLSLSGGTLLHTDGWTLLLTMTGIFHISLCTS